MTETTQYDVRCFRRRETGKLRHGLWIMTRPNEPESNRGAFFHGDRNEVQSPNYCIRNLESFTTPETDWFECEEITPEEALAELENWPWAISCLTEILERHRIDK